MSDVTIAVTQGRWNHRIMFAIRSVHPRHVIAVIWLANSFGAVLLMVEYLVVLPFPQVASTSAVTRANIELAIICIMLSWLVLGVVGGWRTHRALGWTVRNHEPDATEQRLTLGLPWWMLGLQVASWVLSAVAFLVRNWSLDHIFAAAPPEVPERARQH